MAATGDSHRFPAGTGWVVGYVLGVVAGIVGWYLSAEVTIGVILIAAVGPALGVTLEQSLDTTPLTATQRRFAWMLAVTGVIVGVLLLVFLLLT